jgi:hypothetical protein
MPDLLVFLEALGLSAATAALVLLLFGLAWRAPAGLGHGWVLGVGLGLFVGCWLLEVRPRWPPREDQQRFLGLLLPAVVAVECLATWPKVSRGLVWGLRALLAASAGRILLHDSRYLADYAGPGTADWTPAETAAVLGGLAVALMVVWALLALLAARQPEPSVPCALALACGGAGVAVVLGGNLTDGQIGPVLAAALAGAATASFALPIPRCGPSAVGVGVVGLFALALMGRFFGELSTLSAVLLFLAPLLAWLPELRKLRPWLGGVLRVAVVALPLTVALPLARQETPTPPPPVPEPTLDDYRDFVPPD